MGWTGLSKHVDPDQMPQNAASDEGLYCLPFIQVFIVTRTGSPKALFNFRQGEGVPILKVNKVF